MRIHRMRLEGLGPYAQAQDVDFDRLNAAGLFLLCLLYTSDAADE